MTAYTVLITDDEPDVHDILGEYLALAGFRVRHAYDGAEALREIADAAPDLLLLDVQMPELDGFQTLETLKGTADGEDLPVVFVTSLDRVNLKVRGLELGAEDYITKPFQKVELLARVKAALRRTARYRRVAGTLRGELADVGLAELLQTLELGRKSARVMLPAMRGEIVVGDGMVFTVRQGEATGTDALSRLSFMHRGEFVVTFTTPPVDTKSRGESAQSVLMEAVRQVDEARLRLSALSRGNPLVKAGEDHEALKRLGVTRGELPTPLEDLLVAMPGELVAGAESMAKAVRDGILIVVE
ncbi:MAG: response regulator [Thermoleophilia bacterium]